MARCVARRHSTPPGVLRNLPLIQFLFNNLVRPPRFLRPSEAAADAGVEDEDAQLLSADALDETARLPADLGTSGYDVVPAETQGASRNRNGN